MSTTAIQFYVRNASFQELADIVAFDRKQVALYVAAVFEIGRRERAGQ